MQCIRLSVIAIGLMVWLGQAVGTGTWARVAAQDKPAAEAGQRDETLEAVLQRVEKLERELNALKLANGQPVDPAKQQAMLLVNSLHMQTQYVTNQELRLLVMRVTWLNLTAQEQKIEPDDYTLKVDTKDLKLTKLPQVLANSSFYDGTMSQPYNNLKTPSLTLEPGQSMQTWLLFSGLPSGGRIPQLQLSVQRAGQKPVVVDLNESLGRQLQLRVERVGPRKALAVMTIAGALNQLSLDKLLTEITKLNEAKVARFVVQWQDGAPAPDNQCFYWLQEIARQGGATEQQNPQFPPFPSGVGEFHIVPPNARRNRSVAPTPQVVFNQNGTPIYQPVGNAQRGIHDSVDDAISAALASAYQIVPRDELLAEIRNGSALTRPAALANGGGRLAVEDLPLILALADDSAVEMQKAALRALKHFGEPTAVNKLLEYAKRNIQPLSGVAIDSLAGSRFGAAHEALLAFLKIDTTSSRKEIVMSLGRHARPIWSDSLYGYATDPTSDVRLEALHAINVVGHPKLVDLLETCLKDDSRPLAEAALNYLAQRPDRRSEQIAADFTLKAIEKSLPTPAMIILLRKTKDQRALPYLVKHLEARDPRRRELIELIGQIGDEQSIARLAALYDNLENHERVTALNTLGRLKSPVFRDIAAKELNTNDFSVMAQAVNLLQSDGSPRAVELLIEAFKKPGNDTRFQTLANALANLGTPEARVALREALESSPPNRKQVITVALRNLASRSPASQYLFRGRDHEENKRMDEAMKSYDQAIQVDPDHPESRLARANLLLRKDKLEKASEDFAKLMQLDPTNSQGPTGYAIVLARQGKLDEAVKSVEESRGRFKGENLYLYNAACAYGRLLEYVQAHEDVPERDTKIKKYERQALDDLVAAFKAGLDPFNQRWMLEDPDLASIRKHAEFQELAKKVPKEE